MKPALGLPALLSLLACGSPTQPEPLPLSALASRSVSFVLNDTDVLGDVPLPGGHRLTLVVEDLPDGACTRLQEGITATLDGEPMRLAPGGVEDTPGRTQCLQPTAVYDFDPAAWAAAPVEDLELLLQQEGAAPVRLRILGGKAKRRFGVEAPTPAGTLRAGETRLYRYEPASDAGGSASATLHQPGSSVGGELTTVLEPDGRVRVQVPATVPAGNQELHLTRTAPAQLLACEGVAACEGTLFHTEAVPVDIVR